MIRTVHLLVRAAAIGMVFGLNSAEFCLPEGNFSGGARGPDAGFAPGILKLPVQATRVKCGIPEYTSPPPAKPKYYLKQTTAYTHTDSHNYGPMTCPGGDSSIHPFDCHQTWSSGTYSESRNETFNNIKEILTYTVGGPGNPTCAVTAAYSGSATRQLTSEDLRVWQFNYVDACSEDRYLRSRYYINTPSFSSTLTTVANAPSWSGGAGTQTVEETRTYVDCSTPPCPPQSSTVYSVPKPSGFPGFAIYSDFAYTISGPTSMTGSYVGAYSDCAGDPAGSINQSGTWTLENEHTTQQLDSQVRADAIPLPWQLSNLALRGQAGTARYSISPDESTIKIRKLWYRFGFPGEPGRTYTVTWSTIIIGEDGTYVENPDNSWTGTANGSGWCESPDFILDPPSYNCVGIVANSWVRPSYMSLASNGKSACCGGDGSGLYKNVGTSVTGPTLALGLGVDSFNLPSGHLRYSGVRADLLVADIRNIEVVSPSAGTQVIRNASDQTLRQVKSGQVLAHFEVVNATKVLVHMFPASQIGAIGGSGIYPTNGVAQTEVWAIEAPDAALGSYNRVLISQYTGPSSSSVHEYVKDGSKWTYNAPGGSFREESWTEWNSDFMEKITEAIDPVSNTVKKHTKKVYYIRGGAPDSYATWIESTEAIDNDSTFNTGPLLVREEDGEGDDALVTNYDYRGPNTTTILAKVNYPDGRWVEYDTVPYNPPGHPEVQLQRLFTVTRGIGNSISPTDPSEWLPSIQTKYDYDPQDTTYDGGINFRPMVARAVTVGVGITGNYSPISKTAYVLKKHSNGNLEWAKEYRLSTGTATPATDSAALVTTTSYFTSGTDLGRPQKVDRPDGTRTVYEFSTVGGERKETVYSGAAVGTALGIGLGTKTETKRNASGQLISRTERNISTVAGVNNVVISEDIYSLPDVLGRPQKVQHLDGTADYTYRSCCGIDYTVDRDGVTTTYLYDNAKRYIGTSRLGIIQTNALDAAGNVISTKRVGTDGSAVTISSASYRDDGVLQATTDAAGNVTYYSDDYKDGYLERNITQAYGTPAAANRFETYYRNGKLAEVGGSAVAPVRYEYGYEGAGDYSYPVTKTIKLTAVGGLDEWVMTYQNFLGQTWKTVYSDDTPGDLSNNPTAYSYYDTTGRLVKQVDPDGVITRFQTQPNDWQATAVDLNPADGDAINWGGTDRITKTQTEIASEYSTYTRKSSTYEYRINGVSTPTITSTTSTSVDGLKSWSWSADAANAAQTVTAYVGGGVRTVTATASDGSYSVTTFQNGRQTSVVNRASNGTQIGATTLQYDPHGRLWKVTDARNGITVYTYDSADRIVSVTTPAPGDGTGAQVTTTLYDEMGRVKTVTQPDGTIVQNEYFLTGSLKKTYGSRTYKTAYTYDAQGRMKTMTTYNNASAETGARVTTWNYDQYRGWLISKRFQDSNGPDYSDLDLTTSGYTAGGRQKYRLWARIGTGGKRIKTTWTYGFDSGPSTDQHGDVTGISYQNDPASTPAVTISYDRCGHPTTTTVGTMSIVRTFTTGGAPLTESFGGVGTLSGLSESVAYDTSGRRQTVSALNGATSLVSATYGYDLASRLQTVTEGVNTATYGYLANSGLAGTTTFAVSGATKLTATRNYDFLTRIQQTISTPSTAGQPSAVARYRYDAANRRIEARTGDGSVWVYGYDALGQVTSGRRYWDDGTFVAGQQFEYGFDDNGNRTVARSGGDANGANLRSSSYVPKLNGLDQYDNRTVPAFVDVIGASYTSVTPTVNGSNPDARKGEYFWKQLGVGTGPISQSISVNVPGGTAVTGSALVPPTTQTFTYDLDGNLTGDGLWTYTWDAENRLVAMENVNHTNLATTARQKLTFEYDDRGRRIGKKVYPWLSTTYSTTPSLARKYLYDGWNMIAELDGANTIIRTCVWGPDVSGTMGGAGGVGGLLWVKPAGSGAHFAAYDGNGNVLGLTDGSTGTWSAQYEYGPFGELIRADGAQAKANPWRFSTKYRDEESELLYYGHRYLSTSLGRWINRDPSGEHGNDSLYSFAGNNPINGIDYNGLWKIISPSIHEDISKNGFERAISLLGLNRRNCNEWSKEFLEGVKEGVRWNDMPEGTTALVLTELTDYDFPITERVHHGDRQFIHSMQSTEPNAQTLVMNIWNWIELNTKGASVFYESGDYRRAGWHVGRVLHTIQDSYARGHVTRDDDGLPKHYQNYSFQNAKKHGAADKERGSREYYAAEWGSAIYLYAFLGGADAADRVYAANEVVFVGVYGGNYSARAGGSDDEFK